VIETAGKRPLAMTTAARLEVPVAISFQATRRVPGRPRRGKEHTR
jgi:hypothetical protein